MRIRKRGLLEDFTHLSLGEGHWPDRQGFRPGLSLIQCAFKLECVWERKRLR